LYGFIHKASINRLDKLGLFGSIGGIGGGWGGAGGTGGAGCCGNVEMAAGEACCNGVVYNPTNNCCKNGSVKNYWVVCIMSSSDHSWISMHPAGNPSKSIRVGNWHGSKVKGYGGPNVNRESTKRRATAIRCKVVCGPPKIDLSGRYGVIDSNCVTFAISNWNNITGENIDPNNGWFDSQSTASNQIIGYNGGANSNTMGQLPSKEEGTSNSSSGSSGSNPVSSIPTSSQD